MAEPKPPVPAADLSTADAIDRLAKAILNNGPKSPLAMTGMSEEKQRALVARPPGKRYRLIPGVSPRTGATFMMNVVESKTHPNGRVTELRDYKHPDGTYTHEQSGGLVPDGLRIFNADGPPADLRPGVEPPKQSLEIGFLHWRWQEFYQADLREVVGNGKRTQGELKPHMCREPDGMKAPWLTAEAGDVAAE